MRGKCSFRRIRLACVALLAFVLAFAFPAGAEEASDSSSSTANQSVTAGCTVTVAVLGYPNYITFDSTGQPYGYAVAYLQAISDYTGWTYDYEPMTLEEADARVAAGQLDIVVGNSGNPAAEGVVYSAEPMGRGGMMLVSRLDDERYNYNDFSSYNGMKVGVLAGSSYRQSLIDILDAHGVSYTLVDYPSDEACKQALASGEVDALEMNRTRCDANSKIIGQLTSIDIYFLLTASDPTIKQGIDDAMATLLQRNPYFAESLDQEYYGSAITTTLTASERACLESHRSMRVAVCKDWRPFEYFDESSGTYRGMIIDYLNSLQQKSGMQFTYVGYDDFNAMDASVASGEADLVSSLTGNATWADLHGMRITDPAFGTTVVKVGAQNAPMTGRVALIEDSYVSSVLLQKTGGSITPVYFNSTADALDAVRSGQADYTEINAYEASYYLSQAKYSSLYSQIEADWNQSYSLAVPKGSDPTLISLLNKEMGNIGASQMDAIVAANTQVDYRFLITDLVYTDPQAFYLIVILIMLLTAFAAVMLWLFMYTRRQKAALAQASEAKDSFLFDMSHEMRTPLAAIIGMNDMVKEAADTDELRSCAENIDVASNHMLELVNDVLDMTKINEGKYEIDERPFDVHEMMHALDVVYAPMAKEAGLAWDLSVEDGADGDLIGDELRLKQVLVNLISNAIKYNKPGGSVRVSLKALDATAAGQGLRFSVADTGIGISQEDIATVFQPFERVGGATVREVSGTGLGLPIAKAICAAMASTLQVKSTLGQGTRFWFDVHLRHASALERRKQAMDAETVAPVVLRGKRVLVAEDNTINALVVRHLLETRGATVEVGANGKQALDTFIASPVGSYALILMDVRMPVMDGYECARRIRALRRDDAATVSIVAVSANAFAEDEARSLEAGMNAHIPKPIDARVFDRTVGGLLGEPTQDA